MNLRRIRWTLTAWYVAVLLLIILLTIGIAYFRLAHELRQQLDDSLHGSAIGLASQVNEEFVEQQGEASEADVSHELSYVTGASGDTFFAVLTPSGGTLANPLNVQLDKLADPTTVRAAAGGDRWQTKKLGSNKYRLLYSPVYQANQAIAVVVVGRSLAGEQSDLRRLLVIMVATGGLGISLAVAGGLWLAGRALAPAREAFERQRVFVADASHELRTPLTLIRASVEALQRRSRPQFHPEDQQVLADMLAEADRMSGLVADLLALTRLDETGSGQKQLVDLVETLSAAKNWAQAPALNRSLIVKLEAPPAGLLVEANPEQMLRVVRALLDNAINYSPEGGVIELEGARAGANVRVSVSDSGRGLPPQALTQVFDRFFRVEASHSSIEGSGLGLAIAKSIVEAHGGRVWAESQEGQGANFVFTIPAAK